MIIRACAIALTVLLVLPLTAATTTTEAKNKHRKFKTVTRTFTNTEEIDAPAANINDGPAAIYPSSIEVSGLRKGRILDVNLILHGFGHVDPDDVDMLLVAPNGDAALVMSDVGGIISVSDLHLTLNDEAALALPGEGPLTDGSFRPTNSLGDDFLDPLPAPARSHGESTMLAKFAGDDPNGTWRLFINDDHGDGNNVPEIEGGLESGWALEITAKVKAKKKR